MVFSYNSGSRSSRWKNIKKLNCAMSLRKTFICASALIVFRGNYAKFITYIDMMEVWQLLSMFCIHPYANYCSSVLSPIPSSLQMWLRTGRLINGLLKGSCYKLQTTESKVLTFCFTEIMVVSPKVVSATRPGKFISVETLAFLVSCSWTWWHCMGSSFSQRSNRI